jgi:alpha-glucosidase
VHQHFGDRPDQRDELTLIVYPDAEGNASGELYEDTGEGWGFKEGEYLRTEYTARTIGGRIIVETRTTGGEMTRPDRTLNVRVLLPDGREATGSGRDGSPVRIGLPG